MFTNYSLYDNSLPSKPIDFDEDPIRKKRHEPLTVSELAEKLEKLASIEIFRQEDELPRIQSLLEKCFELISKSRVNFDADDTIKIFHALSKLPIDPTQHKKLLSLLLDRANVLANDNLFKRGQSITLLCVVAKLCVDLTKYNDFINTLLTSLGTFENNFSNVSDSNLRKLWLFCAYAQAKSFQNIAVSSLFELITDELPKRPPDVTTSPFQHKIDDTLTNLLSPCYQQDFCEEYPLGAYSLDIAFPTKKLNIEIDGPHHYREERLSRASKFRDFILQSMGWTIVRIPYFDWNKIQNKQKKIDYLLEKLAKHSYLFNGTAISRLKFLTVNTPTRKPNLLSFGFTHNIHSVGITHTVANVDNTATNEKPLVSKKFITHSRYLSEVFSGLVPLTKPCWTPPEKDSTYFSLQNLSIKKKERAAFERTADAAQLTIKFKRSKQPGYYRILIDKDSPGLERSRSICRAMGFFNHDEKPNDNSKIINLIREYEFSSKPKI